MKTRIVIAVNILCIGCVWAQSEPTAQITFKVIDDSGRILTNIPVSMGTYVKTIRGEPFGKDVYEGPKGKTDTNGLVTLTCKSITGGFGYGAGGRELAGYYYDHGGEYWFNQDESKDGKWLPWNPTIEIILKPIIDPSPAYFSSPEAYIRKTHQKYGFDLMVGDWVAPNGSGQNADLFLEVAGYWNGHTNYDSTLIVSFQNSFDGIQEYQPLPHGRGSAFRSPRESPIDGYIQELRLRKARKPGEPMANWVDDTGKDHSYFFRVRSVVDESGNLRSALYGKIENGFAFGGAVENCFINIRSCRLNPKPNSRNMEFDPKRNLFKGQNGKIGKP